MADDAVVHRARESAYRAGRAITDLDSSNAFNRTPRKKILEVLKAKIEQLLPFAFFGSPPPFITAFPGPATAFL